MFENLLVHAVRPGRAPLTTSWNARPPCPHNSARSCKSSPSSSGQPGLWARQWLSPWRLSPLRTSWWAAWKTIWQPLLAVGSYFEECRGPMHSWSSQCACRHLKKLLHDLQKINIFHRFAVLVCKLFHSCVAFYKVKYVYSIALSRFMW